MQSIFACFQVAAMGKKEKPWRSQWSRCGPHKCNYVQSWRAVARASARGQKNSSSREPLVIPCWRCSKSAIRRSFGLPLFHFGLQTVLSLHRGNFWGCMPRGFTKVNHDYLLCLLVVILLTISWPSIWCNRTLKVKQRQNHEKLATGKGIPLTAQSQYFLLPSPWLVQWRIYINMTGKNSSSAPEPELLDGVISTLKCNKVRSVAWQWVGF